MKGQLTRKAGKRQERVENPLALLGAILVLLEHDALRINQAIHRTGFDDLLGPVLDDFEAIRCKIGAVQRHLREIWDEGQQNRWES